MAFGLQKQNFILFFKSNDKKPAQYKRKIIIEPGLEKFNSLQKSIIPFL
jgi:hypothetical protein